MTTTIQPHFPSLEPALIEELNQQASFKEVPAGTELMRPGQFIRSTMLLIEGLIKVYRQDEEGNEFFMYYIQPGQGCALSMICAMGKETSAIAAKAVKDSSLLMVPIEKMDQWMQEYKSWYQFVIQTYRFRFEELLQTLDSVAFRNMDERIEFYLKRHMQTTGSNQIH
ncbi:MAG TPA: Crp/Fnr family transcriptional regulator, partial [Phnomibacter sp.]|nr:Crp/Fnr family transcriptional regulator [Phnomibacter sp.]